MEQAIDWIVCPFLFVCILFICFSALRTREESFSCGENAFYVVRENTTFVYHSLEKKKKNVAETKRFENYAFHVYLMKAK